MRPARANAKVKPDTASKQQLRLLLAGELVRRGARMAGLTSRDAIAEAFGMEKSRLSRMLNGWPNTSDESWDIAGGHLRWDPLFIDYVKIGAVDDLAKCKKVPSDLVDYAAARLREIAQEEIVHDRFTSEGR